MLDEADVMIATQGHQDQSIRIHKNLSSDCQMMLFSATYDQNVMNFAENIISDPVIISLKREDESVDNISQYWVDCASAEAKFSAISNIYGVVTIGQAIIFCQTRKTAAWLVQKLTSEGHSVALLSGDLTVEERIQVFTFGLFLEEDEFCICYTVCFISNVLHKVIILHCFLYLFNK